MITHRPPVRRPIHQARALVALFAAAFGTASAQHELATSAGASAPRVAPGGTISYNLYFVNGSSGPAPANLLARFNGDMTCAWRCTGGIVSVFTPGTPTMQPYACPVPVSGTGNMTATIGAMPATAALFYTADCTVSATAPGPVAATAQAMLPEGFYDTNPSNNQSTATTPVAIWDDVSVTITDSVATAEPGGFLRHDVRVRNAGTVAATSVHITADFPADETCTWVCVGSTCPASQGIGDIDQYADLPIYGAKLDYVADCDVAASATGTLASSASVTLPGGIVDMQTSDNTASDTTSLAPTNASLSIGADPNFRQKSFIVTPERVNTLRWRVQNDSFAAPVTARVTLDVPPRFINARWTCDEPGQAYGCAVRIVDNRWVVQFSMQNVFGGQVELQTGLADGPEETIELHPVISVVNGTDPDPANNTVTTVVPVSLFRDEFE